VGREQEGVVMFTLIDRFNVWFDGLDASPRFGVFMLMMTCSVFLLNLGVTLGNKYAMGIGLIATLPVVTIAVVRAMGRGGKHVWVSHAMMGTISLIVLAVLVMMFF
jgi:hypothetical protein